MNFPTLIPSDAIVFHHNQVRTTSLKVADAFGKQHKNVIRKLESLDCSPEFTQLNFELSEYEDSTGRKLPMWEMTKDGFIFLVMGFTGAKAAQVKEAYINAFNAMAEELARQSRQADPSPEITQSDVMNAASEMSIEQIQKVIELANAIKGRRPLSPAQQRHIQARVAYLATQPGNSFPSVWRSVKDRFNVGSYKDIPTSRFPELCKYLGAPIPTAIELEGEYMQAPAGLIEQAIPINYPASGDSYAYEYKELNNAGWHTKLADLLALMERNKGKSLTLSIQDVSGLRKELVSFQHLIEAFATRLDRVRNASLYAAHQTNLDTPLL